MGAGADQKLTAAAPEGQQHLHTCARALRPPNGGLCKRGLHGGPPPPAHASSPLQGWPLSHRRRVPQRAGRAGGTPRSSAHRWSCSPPRRSRRRSPSRRRCACGAHGGWLHASQLSFSVWPRGRALGCHLLLEAAACVCALTAHDGASPASGLQGDAEVAQLVLRLLERGELGPEKAAALLRQLLPPAPLGHAQVRRAPAPPACRPVCLPCATCRRRLPAPAPNCALPP